MIDSKDFEFYKKYIVKIIKKNRIYILMINGKKYLYTIPNVTPKKEGFFICIYDKLNNQSCVTSLNANIVDYILVVFNDPFFYLIPINLIPIRKDLSIKTGLRLYPKFLSYNEQRQDIFANYLYSY